MTKSSNGPNYLYNAQDKDKQLFLQIFRNQVENETGKSISQLKRDKILARDNYQCCACGKKHLLGIYLLKDTPSFLSKKEIPAVYHVTLCLVCRIRLFLIDCGLVINVDKACDFWCRIYHSGIYRAEQYLNNLALP
ncbi:MAG: hypothetical protein KAR19_12585 [Bacteroidales bacterium]|nr:hypothetical protein [Bacteroidales bacterium]